MPIRRTPDTFNDDDPGAQPNLTHFAFEEWASDDDRHIAVVLEDITTSEGRHLHAGDLITPRQARAEHVRWRMAPHDKRMLRDSDINLRADDGRVT